MKYTKDNVIGLEVVHKDGYNKYKIIGISSNGTHINTICLNSGREDYEWATIDGVNDWLETGIWSLLTPNYEIY